MEIEHDVETFTDLVAECLQGNSEAISGTGYHVIPMPDLGEIFIKTPSGTVFKIAVEESDEETFDDANIDD